MARGKLPTRTDTDESLRAERGKADAELARRSDEVAEDADSIVGTARARADAVLSASRQRENDHSAMRGAPNERAGERASADAVIAAERQVSDTMLDAERLERQVSLAALLALERHATDSHLLLERAHEDQAIESRQDYLALVSHDLRSLLGIVALNATMLDAHLSTLLRIVELNATTQGQAAGAVQVSQYSASIKRATAQMTRLISASLELASFGAGAIVLVRRPHDATALVQQVTKAFETAAMVKKLAISAGCPARSVMGHFDPDRIAQVLTHLIGNAVKFTAAGGRISVNVASQGTDLCFSVHDTGIGVPAERIQTIFDRSAQLSDTGRRERGLGLYIARRLVEAHRGRIWVESALGQGSTFWFSLPASANES